MEPQSHRHLGTLRALAAPLITKLVSKNDVIVLGIAVSAAAAARPQARVLRLLQVTRQVFPIICLDTKAGLNLGPNPQAPQHPKMRRPQIFLRRREQARVRFMTCKLTLQHLGP
jgi:hypothetical protein